MNAHDKHCLARIDDELRKLKEISNTPVQASLLVYDIKKLPGLTGVITKKDEKTERSVKITPIIGFKDEDTIWEIQSFFPYKGVNLVKDFSITSEGLWLLYASLQRLLQFAQDMPDKFDAKEEEAK